MYVNILNKKVAVCTLGCKVNQYESDSMMDILKKKVDVKWKFILPNQQSTYIQETD
jgi:tRNA A37 methylthiotransferase MiaB